MNIQKIIDKITDYTGSQHFLFLDSEIKEYAETMLFHFFHMLTEPINTTSIETALKTMGKLELTLNVRKSAPYLLKEFFCYLETTGLFYQCNEWIDSVSAIENSYLASFRNDGSIRGDTFVKKYTDTGRNDPCPCGSGKKFKKCCMKLIC